MTENGPYGNRWDGGDTSRIEALTAENERLREALRGLLPGIDNLRGYRVVEQRAFFAHVDSIERAVMEGLTNA